MIITTGEPETKQVEDYDFTFVGGVMLPITLDYAAGDSIDISPAVTKVILAAKPSPINPRLVLAAEDVTIFNSQLLSIQHRVREVAVQTPDQKYDWQETLQELGKTIQ